DRRASLREPVGDLLQVERDAAEPRALREAERAGLLREPRLGALRQLLEHAPPVPPEVEERVGERDRSGVRIEPPPELPEERVDALGQRRVLVGRLARPLLLELRAVAELVPRE